jgi:crossover junction endodeoxyribonuclease RusA
VAVVAGAEVTAAAVSSTVTLLLPEPPSANRYWRTHGHITYKTREAKAYFELVHAHARHVMHDDGSPAFPAADVSIVLVWHRSRKTGDLDNRSKVLYDAMQGILYEDDKQIAQDWRRRCDEHATIPKGHVLVEVSAT